ncbi:hypothetical protein SPAN111604_09420 [Sphingomonas antarctica]|uniref:hypothetical protein n=1 Tax=Sphingomonas antarctica TaxID=2040274 RepID=UPI0039E9AE79
MRSKYGLLGIAIAAIGGVVLACADGPSVPILSLEKSAYDPDGNSAFLSPANDSRVNMMLLLADRRPDGLQLLPAGKGAALIMFPWATLKNRIEPPAASQTDENPGRCQTNVSGIEAFTAALASARDVPAAEKAALIAARRASAECATAAGQAVAPGVSVASADGQAFAAYLNGTRAFYRGDFPAAGASFSSLIKADNAWLRETALYMVARNALNKAQSTIFDEYGSILPAEKRDQQAVAAAGAAFEAYLKAYPRSQYTGSAQGLMRRVYWLAGDNARLSAAYDRSLRGGAPSAVADLHLSQEIDYKLFGNEEASVSSSTPGIEGSILIAVDDLKKMRSQPDSDCCTPITAAEIDAQRSKFGSDIVLFDYVRAAHAYFVQHKAGQVLRLIPDASHQRRFTSLEFSRQILRGMALEANKDANARQFWVDLLSGAVGPYQHAAVELAIAMHDERSGALARVFEPNSPVTNPTIREVLLTYTAGPDLLRRQAQNRSVPQRERDVALYLLLAKGVQRGFYADFLRDVRAVPPDAHNDAASSFDDASAEFAEYLSVPAVGLFVRPPNLGDFSCPPLGNTVQALATDPRASTPRICLAEFIRSNGFDHFAYDGPLEGNGLAGTPPQFPGVPYSRQAVYQGVIADPRTTADERAYALYRAVRCYAPSGINDCGGKDVDVSQRRAWFKQLKTSYPNSRWAKVSELYW